MGEENVSPPVEGDFLDDWARLLRGWDRFKLPLASPDPSTTSVVEFLFCCLRREGVGATWTVDWSRGVSPKDRVVVGLREGVVADKSCRCLVAERGPVRVALSVPASRSRELRRGVSTFNSLSPSPLNLSR